MLVRSWASQSDCSVLLFFGGEQHIWAFLWFDSFFLLKVGFGFVFVFREEALLDKGI